MVLIYLLTTMFTLCACAEPGLLTNNPNYCYSTDPTRSQIKMFGTTTPYDEIRGKQLDQYGSKCKPDRFFLLERHGSRFPSVSDGDEVFTATDTINSDIFKNYMSLKTTLCPTDAENIKNWKIDPNFTLPGPAALTQTGWNELNKLATRLQQKFPTLLPKHYDAGHYDFRHSPIPRTLESAQAFASGLFAEYNSVTYEGGQTPDPYLVPFYSCPAFHEVLQNTPEAEVFAQGPYYQKMIKQVSEKLGFYGNQQLNATIVNKLITHCKYEHLYNNTSQSPFCGAFSDANHQVNEYYRDLQSSWMFGYLNTANKQLNENVSCYLLQSMLKFLQSKNPSDKKAQLWFGHDASIQSFFVSMGLFEDEVPMTAYNFQQQTSRKWKTSILTPMGANLAVIRYDCGDADGNNDILFLHNEKPLQIPGCKENGLCKQSFIMEKYSRFLNANCDEIFCTNSRADNFIFPCNSFYFFTFFISFFMFFPD